MTIGLNMRKHEEDINEFWNDNDQLWEKLRDLEDISPRDNLRIDRLDVGANRRNFAEFA